MSRLSSDELVGNPVKKYLSWKNIQTTKVIDGEEYKKIIGGEYIYYDKDLFNEEKGENGVNVSIDFPFEFAILEGNCFSYKGNDKTNNNRYVWTKEISKYTTGNVDVKTKEGVLYTFNIEDLRSKNKETREKVKKEIKAVCKDTKAMQYTQSVYIAVKVDGEYEIWNIQIQKAPLTGGNGDGTSKVKEEDRNDGWFNFLKTTKGNYLKNTIVVDNFKKKVNGDVTFMIPVYELGNSINKEDLAKLEVLYEEVQSFLKYSAKGTKTEVVKTELEYNENLPPFEEEEKDPPF